MILFGIMGFAALVIDIGFARLTQRQMQTAVDAGAIEGLRFRDELPPGYDPSADLDVARRQQASNIVAWTFDDDFDTTNVDEFNFGAGPRIVLGAGIDAGGTINAGQFINDPENPSGNPNIGSLPEVPVYKPITSSGAAGLELNLTDEPHGDMLAGEYIAENPADPNDSDWHDEEPDYFRNDFNVDSAVRNSFLIRMRRSNDFLGLDDSANLNSVSSVGPAIPFLFGRGTLMAAADPSAGYSPRHHGMTVRATAIATTNITVNGVPLTVGNVKLVGPSFPAGLFDSNFTVMSGMTPFVIDVSSWPPTGPILIDASGNGPGTVLAATTQLATNISDSQTSVLLTSTAGFPSPPFKARVGMELVDVTAIDGLFWTIERGADGTTPAAHNALFPVVVHESLGIGTPLPDITAGARIDQLDAIQGTNYGHRYVPLYTSDTIVGFGFADSWTWDRSTNELTVVASMGGHMASENASSGFSGVENVAQAINVLPVNVTLPNSLLAPVSGR